MGVVVLQYNCIYELWNLSILCVQGSQNIIFYLVSFLVFKLRTYDNTFTGDLENRKLDNILLLFLSRWIKILVEVSISNSQKFIE